jgi:hypothetical protein
MIPSESLDRSALKFTVSGAVPDRALAVNNAIGAVLNGQHAVTNTSKETTIARQATTRITRTSFRIVFTLSLLTLMAG